MALVEFVNDSAPYLNAENLNNNFEYLEDKINNGEIYSTNEIKTNKIWIDGKPIYRKVAQSNTIQTIPVDIANLDTMTKFSALIKERNSNSWRSIPWLFVQNNQIGTAEWAGGVYYNNGSISFQMGSNLSDIDKCVVILEYTKTTD